MGKVKKCIAVLLAVVFVSGFLEYIPTDAKEIKVGVPKISLKVLKDESGIKLTIGKTKNAQGYNVYVTFTANNSLFKTNDTLYCYDSYSSEDNFAQKIELSGVKKRTMILRAENMSETLSNWSGTLPAGEYSVRVTAYYENEEEDEYYSSTCLPVTVTIKSQKTGSGYKTSYDFSDVKKGDIIKFGAYEQDGDYFNGQEPIEWIVLSKTKKQIFVISKYILERLPFDIDGNDTWDDCTLRKWLNDKFYNAAFNKTEKDMIKMTKVKNPSNPIYKSRGGKTTNNKLFLLSMTDMINTEYGFSDDYEAEDINRRCSSTKYASIRGAIANRRGYETAEGEGSCLWWLRTPGMEEGGYTCCVEAEGYVETMGVYTSCGNRFLDYSSYGVGVRPVMYISI